MSEALDRFRNDAKVRRGWVRRVSEGTGIKPRTLRSYIEHPKRDGRGSIVEKIQQFYQTLPRE